MKRLIRRLNRQIGKLEKEIIFLENKRDLIPNYSLYPPTNLVLEVDEEIERIFYLKSVLELSVNKIVEYSN